ncbi:threonine aldolase family protein [Pedobacter psychroterrae]|uniref:Threonine aldolase n=1 Tax=Pedobacter psychroterrae TaxID=2530453 RepID=A0A4R0NNU8_9SPHI|nr:GntG family PLP-dependent aldolase [Pedobacter psychroterrae]TCD00854.1 threonine aldolase [Pedobacter psychroterrae]
MTIKVDFRSDTVTKPGPGMLDAMFGAKVGDDVLGEDPTVHQLENKLAAMFNMEAGLFCPSGTMTNQVAIKCHTLPMDEVICDQRSHVYRYEAGGIAYHSMASVRLLDGERGILTPELIEPEINGEDIHYPNSTLVVLENTVNRGGGACYHLSQIEHIHTLCNIKNLKLHLDGARIFNALIATGDHAKDYGKYFDSISVCLSKGLGAPVGSVLLGSNELINKAVKVRKAFGGGMRQAGFLAAAGIYALDSNIDRLAVDHQHALALADALHQVSYVSSILPVVTNIVVFEVAKGFKASTIVHDLLAKGIACSSTGPNTIRMVTHLDISSEMIEMAIQNIIHLYPSANK